MAHFQLGVRNKEKASVVSVSGRVGGPESEELELKLDEVLATRPGMIVLNLHGTEYISSRGLSAMIKLSRTAKAGGTKVALAAVPDPIMDLLASVKLDSLIPVFHGVEDALKSA